MKLTSLRMADEVKISSIHSLVSKAHSSGRNVLLTVVSHHQQYGIKELFPTFSVDSYFLQQEVSGIISIELSPSSGNHVEFDFDDLRISGEVLTSENSKLMRFDIPIQSVAAMAIEEIEQRDGDNKLFILTGHFHPYIPGKFINHLPITTTLN